MDRNTKWTQTTYAADLAENKNQAEQRRHEANAKVEQKYHRNTLYRNEKERDVLRQDLEKIFKVCPVTYKKLRQFHTNQFPNHYEVYRQIARDYMARQEENNERWRRWRPKDKPTENFARDAINTKQLLQRLENYMEDIPVTADDHVAFISRAFPELFMFEDPASLKDPKWLANLRGNQCIYGGNIFSCARACHDRSCFSTRTKPIGNYDIRTPLNFKRFVSPVDCGARASYNCTLIQRQETKPPKRRKTMITRACTWRRRSPSLPQVED